MSTSRFPFIRPCMPTTTAWTPYLECSYAAKRYSNFGPANELLEARLEQFVGSSGRRAILTASATDGLAAVLMGLEIRGEVAVPSFTFAATVQSVLMAGCTPLLCDVDAESWELSPTTLTAALTRGVKAVVHVRPFGLCRDLTPLAQICRVAGIPLIVDSAAALGGRIPGGQRVGGQGTAEVFSLHATKPLGIGEGGLILCSEEDHDRILQSLNFALTAERFRRGLNGKMSEFAAAVGLAVLDVAEETLCRRKAVADRYFDFFRSAPGIAGAASPGAAPWPCFPVLLPGSSRVDIVVKMARSHGLELRCYYRPPMHKIVPAELAFLLPAPNSERLSNGMVCFPVYSDASAEEQAEILMIAQEILAPAG